MTADICQQVEQQGYAIVRNVIGPEFISYLAARIDAARALENSENVSNSSGTYGLRNLVDVVPEIRDLVKHSVVAALVTDVVGPNAFMTRSTLFDKTPGANWGVFWHQDLSIAVEARQSVTGFESWTRKAGVHCVQPPTEYMKKMIAVRIHLDDCNADNGALKVLPGTHRLTKLSTTEVEKQQNAIEEVICEVPAGGAVLMRPLLLHASSPMEHEGTRRVIHLEFANFELPDELNWKYRIPCDP